MAILLTSILLALPVFGIPTSEDHAIEYARVIWQYDGTRNHNESVSINIFNKDMTAQYIEYAIQTHPSSSYHVSPAFADDPILMTVEPQHGFGGEITWGGRSSPLSDSEKSTSGITCRRAWGSNVAAIDCLLPLEKPMKEYPLSEAVGHFDVHSRLLYGYDAEDLANERRDGNLIAVRQNPGPTIEKYTEKGSPLKPSNVFFFTQVTGNHNCGKAGSCSISVGDTKSVSWGFTATATLFGWINAGFNVNPHDTSHTETHSCTGKKGEKICIVLQKGYKGYNVKNCQKTCNSAGGCVAGKCSGNIRVTSPLNDSPAESYCHTGSGCHSEGFKNYDPGKTDP